MHLDSNTSAFQQHCMKKLRRWQEHDFLTNLTAQASAGMSKVDCTTTG